MDYNAWESALSPCQIGRMHMYFHHEGSRQRKLCLSDYCTIDTNLQAWTIRRDTVIARAMDMRTDIIVAPFTTVEFNCRISMPEGGSIKLMEGAHLILNNARLHNACNEQWQGIRILDPQGSQTKVTLTERSLIEDCPSPYAYKTTNTP